MRTHFTARWTVAVLALLAQVSTTMGQACRTYSVRSGDTCSAISTAQGVSLSQLYLCNPAINNPSCNNLQVNQVLQICPGPGCASSAPSPTPTPSGPAPSPSPSPQACRTYSVRSGDTCNAISTAQGVSLSQLFNCNPAINNPSCNNLKVNQVLQICPGPGCGSSAPSPTPTPPSPTPTPSGANPYNIQFGTLTSGKALLTYYDPSGGTGKCGFPLPSLDPSQTPWVAIPLAYWPTNNFGNCNGCNIGCSSSAATLNGQPLCYMVTTSLAKFKVKVGDSCGGNCPPGAPGAGGQHPSCPLTAGSQDCANWVVEGGQQFAYGGVDLYRCPEAHECGPYTGFPAFGSPSVPCPAAGTFQPDFCSGKYMHIDLGVTAQGFTRVCPNGNNCVATYQQVAC